MNDDFLDKAKRAADAVSEKLSSPEVRSAVKETREQAERAIGEVGGFLKKFKRAIQDDIDKRP
ncbi:MAG: hypothetical protein M3Y18_04635 [Candidatus Eremiobacteraeota bacterium]|nr:hypothetical protein [Candidatus Eremiobacteraeota bacterium]